MPLVFEDILKACTDGKMPAVKHVNADIRGQVTTIKDNGRHRGIGVTFPGKNYEDWFHAGDGTDRRSKYIYELEIIE